MPTRHERSGCRQHLAAAAPIRGSQPIPDCHSGCSNRFPPHLHQEARLVAQLLLKLVCVLAAQVEQPTAGSQVSSCTTPKPLDQLRRPSRSGHMRHMQANRQAPAGAAHKCSNNGGPVPQQQLISMLPQQTARESSPEHIDELGTNGLALGLGVCQALQPRQHALCMREHVARQCALHPGVHTAAPAAAVKLPANALL